MEFIPPGVWSPSWNCLDELSSPPPPSLSTVEPATAILDSGSKVTFAQLASFSAARGRRALEELPKVATKVVVSTAASTAAPIAAAAPTAKSAADSTAAKGEKISSVSNCNSFTSFSFNISTRIENFRASDVALGVPIETVTAVAISGSAHPNGTISPGGFGRKRKHLSERN